MSDINLNKLKTILDGCKCSVTIEVNSYRDYYNSVEEEIDNINEILKECNNDLLEDDIKSGMINTKNIVKIQFYPDTPVGSYTIYHYDIERAFDEAIECLRNN